MLSNNKPYRDFSDFLSERFPFKVQKSPLTRALHAPIEMEAKEEEAAPIATTRALALVTASHAKASRSR